MNRRWAALSLTVIGLIAAFTSLQLNKEDRTMSDPQQIKQLVHDYSARNLTADSASIHSHQLIVTNDSKRTVYDLPEDEFFVSIAPFVDTTHPCAIHSLTGCQGEMADEEFEITIEDQEGRRILDQQKVRTMENGFIDLWLPRNRVYEVTIRQGDRTSQAQISTFKNDNTCITTMQLI